MIDNFNRYQKHLKLMDLYPSIDGYCACGCGRILTKKQTRWASRECNDKVYEEFVILKGKYFCNQKNKYLKGTEDFVITVVFMTKIGKRIIFHP